MPVWWLKFWQHQLTMLWVGVRSHQETLLASCTCHVLQAEEGAAGVPQMAQTLA